jgi:hypothetical protein
MTGVWIAVPFAELIVSVFSVGMLTQKKLTPVAKS